MTFWMRAAAVVEPFPIFAGIVALMGCENTMKKEAIEKEKFIAVVTTVPSGAVEGLRKQQEGFGYFRP